MDRYLTSVDLQTVPALNPDVVVVGSGVAGLSAALAAAQTANVLLVAKRFLNDTATWHAQGGIAAALGESSGQAHLEDTLRAGAGLCDETMVRILVDEGVERVRELVESGVNFDRHNGELALTLEGGHGERRVLHADGDSTGRTLQESLAEMVGYHENIQVLEEHFVIDLLHAEGAVYGVLGQDTRYGRLLRINAPAVVLATGGMGQVYRETTNPEVATGDGYAMACRAGATLVDMEFVQFHPTTLYLAGAPRFLISEAVRGEGAHLITMEGERFMPRFHPDAELAPRDVVSQSIFSVMHETETSHVLLDLRHLDPALIDRRFPTIKALCADYGLEIASDCIPVRPACHYMMGGVQTDAHARTSVSNLYACGEVASTGVHGANRLASNSLLEGLVFGHRAGDHAARSATESGRPAMPRLPSRPRPSARTVPLDIGDVIRSLRALAWRELGVYRSEEQLDHAERTIAFWERYVLREEFTAPAGWEAQNMLTVGQLVARAARRRTESRGAHQRFDHPETDDETWRRHLPLTIADFES
jgi:L-aspartate oxidase